MALRNQEWEVKLTESAKKWLMLSMTELVLGYDKMGQVILLPQ